MTTAAEALAAYYAANGIEADPARTATWICKIGPASVEFPNWKWRRDAITRHDLHHILTGYSCTMTGEMQMAAWEFAAGRYRQLGGDTVLPALGADGRHSRTTQNRAGVQNGPDLDKSLWLRTGPQ